MSQDPAKLDNPSTKHGSHLARQRAARAALRISGVYVVVALVWIAVSDRIVEAMVGDQVHRLTWFQTTKGCAFVLATGVMLYAMVRSYIRNIQKADEKLRIETQASLAQHQVELEQRVEQRTQQLSRANEELKKQIAERHAILEQLRAAKMAAESANNAKSVFLANTSHEVRTPLTSILGYADLLMEQSLSAAQRERYVGIVQQNAAHLLRLIDDLLDLSRVEMGKMSVTVGEYSPREVAQQAVDLLRPRASEKHLQMSLDVAENVPLLLKTDGVRLRQILANLLSNAIKFTSSGRVGLWVRMAESSPGTSRTDGAMVRFEVSDTGIGVKASELARIFEPFYQVDQGAARRYGGSGLGLAISRQLAEQMGGTISVESEEGKGSTFVVQLPVEMQEPPRVSETRLSGNDRIHGHILLAEDNANIRWLVEEYLRRAGATVTAVANGLEAVQCVARSLGPSANGQAIDLALIDIHMPDMDGPQAMRQMRQAGYAGPIVALTAHSVSDQRRWQDLGCDALATKPIDRKTFIPLVARLIEERQHAQGVNSAKV